MMKKFTKQFKSNVKIIGWITIVWVIIGLLIFSYDFLLLHTSYVQLLGFNWKGYLLSQILACFLSGITAGTVVVVFFQKWLRTMPYGRALIFIFLVYSVMSVMIGFFAGSVFFSTQKGLSIFSPEVMHDAYGFLVGIESSRFYFVWLFVMMGTLTVLLVNDKYGPGVFVDMLLGKYFQPRREERIFMFLDLKGSTTIAEKIGEEKYFDFIRSVFADATPAILNTHGEIYQYIGDEILISWRMGPGLSNANCIQCFFEIKKIFQDLSEKYKSNYGVLPEFKAGVHCGPVMAGEVGVVKRDIAFSGDVLNTAARIEGKCNELGTDILLSSFLLEKITNLPDYFTPKKVGEILLRGKQERVILYTL